MSSQKIEELTLNIAEIYSILNQLKQRENIEAISQRKKKLETELAALRAQSAAKTTSNAAGTNAPKRYVSEITNFASDQSAKFVKFYITLDGVQNVPEENVVVTFEPRSILLYVSDVQNKDYKFEVKNLLYNIDTATSYRKVKTNCVNIYAKKAEEGKKWSHLTATEKRLDDIRNSEMEPDNGSEDDPSAGLMNMMKSMYESGDSETKRMIAKAFTEGQDKKMAEMEF